MLLVYTIFAFYKYRTGTMAHTNEMGKEGEAVARRYLEQQGYVIACTNWHWHHYELDIVAVDGKELVVVEVKTRADDYLLSPEEAVDAGKIRRIVTSADAYARLMNVALPVRFDIITLIQTKNGYQIDHIKDAFYAPCN
jgi:putative endonuclease